MDLLKDKEGWDMGIQIPGSDRCAEYQEFIVPSLSMKMKPDRQFYRDIYAIVSQIPPGNVCTYGHIALLAGRPRAARLVGYAMHAVPPGQCLPCHRVVNRLGELAPAHVFGDRAFQKALLESEGITFLPDGRINLARHFWHGPEQEEEGKS